LRDFRLYVILDLGILQARGDTGIGEIARQIILGGADILQLRAKGCSDRRILQIGSEIKNLTAKSK
jgi:thiamine monophosphate synthase